MAQQSLALTRFPKSLLVVATVAALSGAVGGAALAQSPVPVANSVSTASDGAVWIARSELPPAPSGFEWRCRASAPNSERCPVVKRNGFVWVPYGTQGSSQMMLMAFDNGPTPRARVPLWGLSDVAQINVSGSGSGATYQFVGSVGMQESIGVGTGQIDNLIREYTVATAAAAPAPAPAAQAWGNADLARTLNAVPATAFHPFMTKSWLPASHRNMNSGMRLACPDTTCPVLLHRDILWIPYELVGVRTIFLFGYRSDLSLVAEVRLNGFSTVRSASQSGGNITYSESWGGQGASGVVTLAQFDAAASGSRVAVGADSGGAGSPPASPPAATNYGNEDLARTLRNQPNTVLHAFMTAAWLPRAPRETQLACPDTTCPVIFHQNVLWVPYTRQGASNVQLFGFKADGSSAGSVTLQGIATVRSAAINGSTVTFATSYAGQGSTASVTAAQLEAAARNP